MPRVSHSVLVVGLLALTACTGSGTASVQVTAPSASTTTTTTTVSPTGSTAPASTALAGSITPASQAPGAPPAASQAPVASPPPGGFKPDAATAQTPMIEDFKGVELYSWQDAGVWHFALAAGTNASKQPWVLKASRPDSWGSATNIRGVGQLAHEIARVPKGADVFWANHLIANEDASFKQPPASVVAEVSQLFSAAGLTLQGP